LSRKQDERTEYLLNNRITATYKVFISPKIVGGAQFTYAVTDGKYGVRLLVIT
jgi:hypothetical protein